MATPAGLPTRSVTLVLCTRGGEVLGALPAFDVPTPWWQQVEDVVAECRRRHSLDVTVLRLLDVATELQVEGGPVSYLAEVTQAPDVDLAPWSDDVVRDHPLRLAYARPGGPAQDLSWADHALRHRGVSRRGPAEQMRTWNLSSVWRLKTSDGIVWLKVVPPFFAHEGQMLARLGRDHPDLVPPLLATDGPRVLMADVPGGDHYDADTSLLFRLVRLLVRVQVEWVQRVPELQALDVLDWRGADFMASADDVFTRTAGQLDPDTARTVSALVAGLDQRFVALGGCGVPDTLVHGDFHPGNACGQGDRLVLLDWGDCGIGNPLLDQAAFTARLSSADQTPVLAEWSRLWREAVPGCDPDRARDLLRPVAALRQANVYQMFLDNIEPAERVYHVNDPAHWLRRAAQLA